MTLIQHDDTLFVLKRISNVHENCRFCNRKTREKTDPRQIIRTFWSTPVVRPGVCFLPAKT